MRISEIDLQCEDIMWFATDNKGNIFECTLILNKNPLSLNYKAKEFILKEYLLFFFSLLNQDIRLHKTLN